MAGKPDLSAGPGVQNVVVYVSNDNFAQAYTVGQQNVSQNAHLLHNAAYGNPPSMAPSLGPPKTFQEKHSLKPPEYSSSEQVQQQGGYFASVISQGYANNVNYPNGAVLKSYGNGEVLSVDRQAGPVKVREDCDTYVDSGYVTVMGAEGAPHSVRCDSARSETAESSCSSLSSADEGLVIVQNQPPAAEMVVYEGGGVNSRSSGVVVALGGPHIAPQTLNGGPLVGTLGPVQKQCVMVPYGWKRLLNNGCIIYISPSNTALASPEQVKEYLLTAGTCKCGLECHFKYDSVFNFDPKVGSKPWILMPDTSTGDLTKLCNHKRKIMATASLDCKPPDHVKLRRAEYNIKRKKRKIGLPYSGGISVSQILAHREKVALNQHSFNKELVGNPHQACPPQHAQPAAARLSGFPGEPSAAQALRYREGASAGQQAAAHAAPSGGPSNGPANIQSHRIVGPDGRVVEVQGSMVGSNHGQINQIQQANGTSTTMLSDPQNTVQTQDLHQRIFVNGQPNEPTGPGRPQTVQMVPVSQPAGHVMSQAAGHVMRQAAGHVMSQAAGHVMSQAAGHVMSQAAGHVMSQAAGHVMNQATGHLMNQQRAQQQQQQLFYNSHAQYQQGHGFDGSKNVRPFAGQMMTGFRPHGMMGQGGQMAQGPVQHHRMQWQNRMQHTINQHQHIQLHQQHPPNVCERVPPLHQQPPPAWQEEMKRKRAKPAKATKGRPYCPGMGHAACPNVDVRQIAGEGGRAVIVEHAQGGAGPSFLEDPSGYLAQQTALLNSTINRQTGASGCTSYVCNSPSTSLQNPQQHIITVSNAQTNEINLPSNVMAQQMKLQHPINQNIPTKQIQNVTFARNQQMLQQPYGQVQIQPNNMADSSIANEQPQYPAPCQCCIADPYQHPKTGSRPSSNEDPVTSSTYSDKQFNQPSPDSRPIQGGTVSTSNDGVSPGPPTPNPNTPTPPQRPPEPSPFHVAYSQHNPQMEHLGYANNKMENICCSYAQAAMSGRTGLVTTMASGRTHGSDTLTSVLAGRTNTATVSINSPSTAGSSTPTSMNSPAVTVNVSKSPLEMVQSVVSSIQVPQSSSQMSPHLIKHSPTGHIFVSSGGQLIMASTGNQPGGMMAPPPPKIPAVTQVMPAQTVLVNALPAPFVLQPGVAVTVDGHGMQLPQLVAGNVVQQQIQLDGHDARRAMLSPETRKKSKKRKGAGQTVANMLHVAAQQSPGVVMAQQGFPQQIQMAHSPQGPVMQALTIVPSKHGGPPQIVMNGQPNLGPPQIIANSPTQQINLLQPVNLINGPAGMVQNFPAIQQFIVPNLGGMVMNADGSATILQDTSNLGVQLQIQNVNGQNVLTPVQNNGMFAAGMVIRSPASQGKQHSPGAQFLSPGGGGQFVVNGGQFGGQLSPLNQQVAFGAPAARMRPGDAGQEYVQLGQTLMVPCAPSVSVAGGSAGRQNATFVQQNTTIVQQQTTMVANNQQVGGFQQDGQESQQGLAGAAAVNLDQQNYIISSNDNKQMQVMVQQQQQQHHSRPSFSTHHGQSSVSTQTAINQPPPSLTSNPFRHAPASCDTTTLSPLPTGGRSSSGGGRGSGGRSPPTTADTTTHAGGSTDDAASPAPSVCSGGGGSEAGGQSRPQSCTMAMVHCVSSSEPDSADLLAVHHQPDGEWRRAMQGKALYDASPFDRRTAAAGGSYSDEATVVEVGGFHYVAEQMKSQEVVSSRNYEKMIHHKRKSGDESMVMEVHHGHTSLFHDDDEGEPTDHTNVPKPFAVGELVWGPAEGRPFWPGKIVEARDRLALVKWFGTEKPVAAMESERLQTLTEGLEAHHRARKKWRTSRKLNSQLEKAIQEAMAELDKEEPHRTTVQKERKNLKTYSKATAAQTPTKKAAVRSKNAQR